MTRRRLTVHAVLRRLPELNAGEARVVAEMIRRRRVNTDAIAENDDLVPDEVVTDVRRRRATEYPGFDPLTELALIYVDCIGDPILRLGGAARRQVVGSALKAEQTANPELWIDEATIDWDAIPDTDHSVPEVAWGKLADSGPPLDNVVAIADRVRPQWRLAMGRQWKGDRQKLLPEIVRAADPYKLAGMMTHPPMSCADAQHQMLAVGLARYQAFIDGGGVWRVPRGGGFKDS